MTAGPTGRGRRGGLVWRRALADPAPVLAVALNVLVVCTLVAGLGASLGALEQRALRSVLEGLPAADTVVAVSTPYDEDDPDRQDRLVRGALSGLLAPAGGRTVTLLESTGHDLVGAREPVRFAAPDGAPLEYDEGRAPRPGGPLEVAAPAGGGLAVGDRAVLVDRSGGERIVARVVGTWTAPPEARRATLGLDPAALVVHPDAFGAVAGPGSAARWWAVPDLGRLRPDRLDDLAGAVAAASVELDAAGEDLSVRLVAETGLADVLGDRARELTVLRGLLLAPAALLVLVAAAGLLLVAAGLAQGRRDEESLLRSRGAGHRQLVAPTLVEALALCAGAALVAPLVATLLVRIGDVRPPLTPAAWLAAAAAALVCALALVAPAAARAVTGDRGRPASAERRQRRALTAVVAVVLVAAAAGVLAVVTLRGFGDAVGAAGLGTRGVDPLLVAAPALLLLAVGVLASLLLVPPALGLLARALGGRGVAAVLGSRFAARAPSRAVPLALVVSLAAGSVAFALVERESSAASREARAEYVAGADARVVAPPDALRAGAAEEERALGSLPGVRSVRGVRRDPTFVDDLPAELLVAPLTRASPGSAARLLGPDADPSTWHALDVVPARGGPLPVLLTEDLADAAALAEGDTVTLSVLGVQAPVRVAGTVPYLRTVPDGAGGILAAAGPTLAVVGGSDTPDEWWLDVAPDRTAGVARALAERPEVAAEVVTVDEVLRRLDDDPSTGGAALAEVLLLTGGGSLAVGALVLGSLVLLRRRERAEQARMLGAAGGDRRDLLGTLSWEYALTAGAGLAAGLVAGAGVAAVTLASLTLGPDGDPLLPAPALVVPWVPVLLLPAGMLALPPALLAWSVRRAHRPGLGLPAEGGRP